MNNFSNIESGSGLLKNYYPTNDAEKQLQHEALLKKLQKLRDTKLGTNQED